MSWLLAVHVSCVVLTIAGFVLRGIWMIRNSPLLGARWVRVVPHIVDTVLLAAGIALAIHIRQYPFVNAWLTAKTLGLIVYIGLGAVALRHGRTRRVRIAAWIGALFAAGYIVAVAVTRNPLPAVAQSQVFAPPLQHSLRQKTSATADPLPVRAAMVSGSAPGTLVGAVLTRSRCRQACRSTPRPFMRSGNGIRTWNGSDRDVRQGTCSCRSGSGRYDGATALTWRVLRGSFTLASAQAPTRRR